MRLFKSPGNYVVAFLACAACALLSFHHPVRATPSTLRVDKLVCFSQVLGSFCVAFLFFKMMKKTTYIIEKTALALSGAYFVLYLLSVLQTFGYLPRGLSSNRPIFVTITGSLAVLAGLRLFQVLSDQGRMAD
jgi:hypothetical protein